jgi:multicomponent Na+:H+ antiporter subunit G
MNIIGQWISLFAIVIATFFSMAGVIGFIRLPDVYSRLHATGKVGIFGVILLTIAAIFQIPDSLGKSVLLIVILFISGPSVAQAIANTAYQLGITPPPSDQWGETRFVLDKKDIQEE